MQYNSEMMRLPAVIRETGRKRSAIYRDIERGEFPAPVRIGARAVAWTRESIDAWKATRPLARGDRHVAD